jgi:hypothetical protein
MIAKKRMMRIRKMRMMIVIMLLRSAIRVPKARDLEAVLIGVDSNHGLATVQGLKPKSGRF